MIHCWPLAVVSRLLFITILLLGGASASWAHPGDLQQLLRQGAPKPFVGGQAVKIEGEAEVIHGDDFVGSRSFVRYFVRSFATHELVELGFEVPPALVTGQAVSVRGRQQGSVVWVKDVVPLADGGGGSTGGSGSGTATAPVLTERTAIAILINLTDATLCADPATCTYTPAYVAGKVFTNPQSMRNLYLNSSYGQTTFRADTNGDGQPDVVGPYNLNVSRVGCNWTEWSNAANSAAQAEGVNLSLYQHKIYVLPHYNQLPDCDWAGLAYIGGDRSYIAEPGSMMVYAHELGHNLSMAHAGTDPENDGIMNEEYGDSSDPMGSSRAVHNFNGAHIDQKSWFTAFANAVQSVTTSGSYQIAPIGNPPDGTLPQVLRIFKPNTNEYYYLSYRQPIDWDSSLSSTYTRGVNVHRYKGAGYNYTYFLNSLPDNGMFTDLANAITVVQATHGSSFSTVQVTFGCAANTPSVSLAPASVWVKGGSAVTFTGQVTNLDAGGCGPTTWTLGASTTTGGSPTVTPSTRTLAPGATDSTTVSLTPSTSGTLTLTAQDTDGADPAHPTAGTATAQINVDSTAPTAPTNLSASAVKQGIRLSWSASSDSGGSGVTSYYLYRNGSAIGSTGNTQYTDSSGSAGVTYTYTVTAVDQVGNESGMSNAATITYPGKSTGGSGGGGGGKPR
jgi:hypothetical protein